MKAQEVLAVRKSYREEVLAVLTSNRKEVLYCKKLPACETVMQTRDEVEGLQIFLK